MSMDARILSARLRGSIETRDKFLLSKLDVSELIETNFLTVRAEHSLEELIRVIAQSNRNIFPVVDEQNKLLGVVHLDRIRAVIFGAGDRKSTTVADLMAPPPAVVGEHENLHQVLSKFEETKSWNLPVVDDKGCYVGFLSKSSILARYRNELMESM